MTDKYKVEVDWDGDIFESYEFDTLAEAIKKFLEIKDCDNSYDDIKEDMSCTGLIDVSGDWIASAHGDFGNTTHVEYNGFFQNECKEIKQAIA